MLKGESDMELELQRENISTHNLVLNTTICQEETLETIVPDACPDILRILDTRAQACLTSKQVRDGLVTVTGVVRASVLYRPEDSERPVCHIEISVPFTSQTEAPDLTAQGTMIAVPRVRRAEARILNPRKVLLRVDIVVDVDAYQNNDMELCCSAKGNDQYAVQQLVAEEHITITSAVREKAFTYSDRIDFGVANQSEVEVLNICGEAVCSESKLVGNKLVFKGFVNAEALLCENGELRTVNQPLAFSQIMEVSQVGEGCSCAIRMAVTDLRIQYGESVLDNEFTVELLAQAVVREHKTVEILRDLYSTGWNTDTTVYPYRMHQAVEDGEHVVLVRDQIETTTLVRGIIHYWVDLGEVRIGTENGHSTVTAETNLNILYLDDVGEVQSLHKSVAVPCRLDAAGTVCRCWCSAPREVFVTPSAGGMEIRFSMDFHCLTMIEKQLSAILAASVTDERTRGETEQPSVVLRMAVPGERLWDIAKLYGTTEEEIMRANELEEEELPHGKMLLIPRVR